MQPHDANAALLEAVVDAFTSAPLERARLRWERSAPEPWHGWLLAALVRQLSRQAWLVRVIEEHGLRELGGDGKIPGLHGHRYRFHGIGCCIELPSGELLDVDFWGDDGLTINPYFFARRVWSIAQPALVEARVREYLPSEELCELALKQLRGRGLLWHDTSDHAFRLPTLLEQLATVQPDFDDEAACSLWCHHLGDFHGPGAPGTPGAVRRRAHHAYLLMCLAHEATALAPLVSQLPEATLMRAVEAVLSGPITPRTGALVEQLDHQPLPLCSAVLELVDRLRPSEHHPFTAFAVARYLYKHRTRIDAATNLMLAFARVERVESYDENPFLGQFAILALEYARPHALELLRRALRSTTPNVLEYVAAALVVLDFPWCIDELTKALNNATAPELCAALTLLTGAPPDGSECTSGDAYVLLEDSLEPLRARLGPLRAKWRTLPFEDSSGT